MDVTVESKENLGIFLNKNKAIRYVCFYVKCLMVLLNKNKFGASLVKTVNNNFDSVKEKCNLNRLMFDLLKYKYIFGFSYKEYFLYDFVNKSKQERMKYLGNYERHFDVEKIIDRETEHIFSDKFNTYQNFQPFYKRQVIKVGKDDFDAFCEFVNLHKKVIAKPLCTSQGAGIRIIENGDKRLMFALFNQMIQISDFYVLEEIVIQDEKMSAFHPQSVNTVRFVTYYKDNIRQDIFACVRIGMDSSVVDNFSAGGIGAVIDVKTGKIVTPAHRKLKNSKEVYEIHPETKVKILNAQIPYWNELLDIVEKIVKVVPQQSLVGWDFACTDKGWVLIEANLSPGFSICQMCGIGLREKFDIIKKDSL